MEKILLTSWYTIKSTRKHRRFSEINWCRQDFWNTNSMVTLSYMKSQFVERMIWKDLNHLNHWTPAWGCTHSESHCPDSLEPEPTEREGGWGLNKSREQLIRLVVYPSSFCQVPKHPRFAWFLSSTVVVFMFLFWWVNSWCRQVTECHLNILRFFFNLFDVFDFIDSRRQNRLSLENEINRSHSQNMFLLRIYRWIDSFAVGKHLNSSCQSLDSIITDLY